MSIKLTEQNFDAEVLQSALPVVVDFWADWCGPCKMMGPVLEELAAIAFANGTDFATITHNGLVRLTPTDEVPEEKKKAVASIKEGQYGTEIKLHDKVRALELLGKHLGVFDTNNGSANEQENNIFEVIEESTREEIGTDEIPEIEPPAKPGHDLVE